MKRKKRKIKIKYSKIRSKTAPPTVIHNSKKRKTRNSWKKEEELL